jgi:protein-S-isoprenylcysteine O-methyltransferase
MVAVGQTVRTAAMVQAGESFNHMVQTRRRDTHKLVTGGIYGWLRHPSYFGFYWWGVGGQLVLGNWVSLAAYTVVLWLFFINRIKSESSLFG